MVAEVMVWYTLIINDITVGFETDGVITDTEYHLSTDSYSSRFIVGGYNGR